MDNNSAGLKGSADRHLPPFEISNLRPVTAGRVRWRFDLSVFPFICVRFCLVAYGDSRPDRRDQLRRAVPEHIKDCFTREYVATTFLDRTFARDVFCAARDIIREVPEPDPQTIWRCYPREYGLPPEIISR